MSLMEGSLAREIKMLKACGKKKTASDGFWFWFTSVDGACVLLMRPRERDPDGAQMKSAVARARNEVKKATRKSPKKFVTGEAYYEESALRFYGNRALPGFRDDIREFAKEHRLRFLVGAQLYAGKRGRVDLDDASSLGIDEDLAEDLEFFAGLPDDDPDFDVDTFLLEEVGAVKGAAARARDLMLDPSVELLTPAELQARTARSTRAARQLAEQLRRMEEERTYLLLKVSRSDDEELRFQQLAVQLSELRQRRDAALLQAEWFRAAMPAEGEEAAEQIRLDRLSPGQRAERRQNLAEELVGLAGDAAAQQEQLASARHYRDKAAGKAEHAFGELAAFLKEKGIASPTLATLLATVEERARPVQDLAEGQAELDHMLAQYRALQARDTAKMTPDQAHQHLRQKLKLSQKLEEKRANARLWDTLAATGDMDDTAMERFQARFHSSSLSPSNRPAIDPPRVVSHITLKG
jgi:hypothetical protein